jgi:DNA-binding XRE family transcriptional regulator
MPRLKPTRRDLKERQARAVEWKSFRKVYLFTQKRLGDIVGISRRTVQQIEAGKVTPHPATLRKFISYRQKCEANADI